MHPFVIFSREGRTESVVVVDEEGLRLKRWTIVYDYKGRLNERTLRGFETQTTQTTRVETRRGMSLTDRLSNGHV